MKKILAIFLSFVFAASLVGCGTSTQGAQSPAEPASEEVSVQAASEQEASAAEEQAQSASDATVVDMLYYKDLGDGSIMAACYTDEGISWMGEDYYVVHVSDAKIYNAAGEEITLEELTRGCPIRVQWPGMVLESYPGQISAEVVTAISDEAMEGIPSEDNIPVIGDGPKWWEEETVTEVPPLILNYTSPDAIVTARIDMHNGNWGYSANSMAGGSNKVMDGQTPQEWNYDDNNTIRRNGFDVITLSVTPEAQEMTVTAYAPDQTDGMGTPVELDAEGNLTLLDGDYIYVVNAVWNSEDYQGEATYGFLVMAS